MGKQIYKFVFGWDGALALEKILILNKNLPSVKNIVFFLIKPSTRFIYRPQ